MTQFGWLGNFNIVLIYELMNSELLASSKLLFFSLFFYECIKKCFCLYLDSLH